MTVKSVHFINRYPVIKQVARVIGRPQCGSKQEVEWVFARVDFQLGLGPCGKVVTDLDVYLTDTTLTLHQEHDDGTRKAFIYQLSDIAGRIVVEHDKEPENV